jgi:hypothetical protein
MRRPFRPHQMVKDVVGAAGIPHTEVDLIVVNGEPVDLSQPIRDASPPAGEETQSMLGGASRGSRRMRAIAASGGAAGAARVLRLSVAFRRLPHY